ncbi:pyruvate kinase [Thermosynechococcus sp.]|uniref:pyruvate kinase n=1 Tax=Thermosynechococcus sp. TaxID=2814275 RepID=UPI00391B0FA8
MLFRRTKIVATIGPASRSRDVIQQMLAAGMNVARLNFSHGDYKDHAETIALLRQVANAEATPLTLLQDLQGPKIRVGELPQGSLELVEGEQVTLVPLSEEKTQGIGIDYPYLAEEAQPGMQVLLDDGLLELVVEAVEGRRVICRVVQGGTLKSRKGVNLPDLSLRLPSLTDKDKQDIQFGIEQGVDIISLSFVRRAEDLWELREYLAAHGAGDMPVLAKIEKPQAVENLSAILGVADAIMIARGDLGVEMPVEKVPLLQKQIIRECNYRSIPVITATQMLESMIHHPRPTRAEVSDVANAILDGTDAVMLSGESAVGAFPVQAVKMLARIAADVEPNLEFDNMPAYRNDETHALGEALTTITQILDLRAIACFTETGYTATIASGERVKPMIVAFTDRPRVYHRLNLLWGVKPILLETLPLTFEGMVAVAENQLKERQIATEGDKIVILGGIPAQTPQGTNFIKIHTIRS